MIEHPRPETTACFTASFEVNSNFLRTENLFLDIKVSMAFLVADLQRSLDFYCGLLGFELTATYGDQAAFISAGGYHHHIGLNTWHSKNGDPAPKNSTGLFHTAILYPSRKDLAVILRRLMDADYPFTGAADHGVSEALYLDDPDQNGVELYWDRPRDQWPKNEDGSLHMYTRHLDLEGLLAELN